MPSNNTQHNIASQLTPSQLAAIQLASQPVRHRGPRVCVRPSLNVTADIANADSQRIVSDYVARVLHGRPAAPKTKD